MTNKISEKEILEFYRGFDIHFHNKEEVPEKSQEKYSKDDWPAGEYRNVGRTSASDSSMSSAGISGGVYGRLD